MTSIVPLLIQLWNNTGTLEKLHLLTHMNSEKVKYGGTDPENISLGATWLMNCKLG